MKNIYINIEVAGEYGTGETTIAYAIGHILKSHGMQVAIYDDYLDDDPVTPEIIDRNLTTIGTSGNVMIHTRQIKRTTL